MMARKTFRKTISLYLLQVKERRRDIKSGSLTTYWPSCTYLKVRCRSDRNHALLTDASDVYRYRAYRA